MNRDIVILQKMAQEAAEATSNFAKAWEHIKNNRYTYGGAGIGALAGGAGAAFATKDKKNRIRNTLLGALGGGVVGGAYGLMPDKSRSDYLRQRRLLESLMTLEDDRIPDHISNNEAITGVIGVLKGMYDN